MTTDHAAFLRAVIEAPDDDAPRLAYADALELGDAGFPAEPARAEFIRLQCELAKPDADILPGGDGPLLPLIRRTEAQRDALRERERDLLKAYGQVWNAPVYKALNADRFATPAEPERHLSWEFHRGFPSRLTLSWQDWQTHAAELLAACPIARAADGLVRLTTTPRATWLIDGLPSRVPSRNVSWTALVGHESNALLVPCNIPYADRLRDLLAAEWPGVRFELPRVTGIDMACGPDATAITMTWRPGDGSPPVTVPVHLADTFAGRVDG